MSDISKRILAIMNEQQLSYGQLAAATGIPKSALQRYATGATEKIPLERLEAIAAALHVTVACLIGREGEKPVSREDAELMDLLETLRSREDMRMLFKLSKDATPEDVRQAVKIIEALRTHD